MIPVVRPLMLKLSLLRTPAEAMLGRSGRATSFAGAVNDSINIDEVAGTGGDSAAEVRHVGNPISRKHDEQCISVISIYNMMICIFSRLRSEEADDRNKWYVI